MPISIQCTKCDKKMKVADAVAGKKIRCPACKAVIAVPKPEEEFEQPDEEFETPDEETAVTEAPAPKKKKRDFDDEEPPAKKRKKKDEDDGYGFDEEDDDDEEEERRRRKKKKRRIEDDYAYDFRGKRRAAPHRGVLILILGILSVLSSCLCAIPAFAFGASAMNMATTDLAQMENGFMDRDGRAMTVAGKACGIIGCALGLLAIILNVGYLITKGGKF